MMFYSLEIAELGDYTLVLDTPAGELKLIANLDGLQHLEPLEGVSVEAQHQNSDEYLIAWEPVAGTLRYELSVIDIPSSQVVSSVSTTDTFASISVAGREQDRLSIVVRAINFNWHELPDYPVASETHVPLR